MVKRNYDEVISRIIIEIDTEYAEYQRLHERIYGKVDADAKNIYKAVIGVCNRIRSELSK